MFDSAISNLSPALLRAQQGYGWHMHDGGYMFGHYWGWGAAVIHVAFWLLVLAAIVLVTLFIARSVGGSGKGGGGSTALDQLDERYAKGEIDREEYLQRKKDITER